MIVSIEETPSKCNHVTIIDDLGNKVVTTKDMLIPIIIEEKIIEEKLIEEAKMDVSKLGTTDWAVICDSYKAKVIK